MSRQMALLLQLGVHIADMMVVLYLREVHDDIPSEQLEQLKTGFYRTKVAVTAQETMEIEQNTRDQADSTQWLMERRKRLTASKVGGIAKMRKDTKRSKKIQNLLYST